MNGIFSQASLLTKILRGMKIAFTGGGNDVKARNSVLNKSSRLLVQQLVNDKLSMKYTGRIRNCQGNVGFVIVVIMFIFIAAAVLEGMSKQRKTTSDEAWGKLLAWFKANGVA